ncbi:Tat pathway signal sequence domain protein [Streptomyces bungoensis]|uniref:Tat pathway signal sequence domain protein n=1 Tax=Streptomyces bungoensis TaxID=285568 RepID=A0A101T4F0_9ACTN|nr:DUF4429 domain-containing protein [Streptomyces bungoensis]KUN85506.1 Tat pathway signal sequence domain protein [Streptomyces bungoensis]
MAEIIQRDGAWAFDGGTIRITPGLHRRVALFRQAYGEIAVPLEAVRGVVCEAGRGRGRLGLRLREGADPLLQATGGRLPAAADPYRLEVDADRGGTAEYVAEEIRRALLLDRVPREPTTAYLLPGPPVPVSVRSSDGTVSFDGTRVRIDWADTSGRAKRAAGPRIIALGDLAGVEWLPNSGHGEGFLRFVTREAVFSGFSGLPPERDPHALDLWGSVRRDLLTALVAAAVTARLPHPSTRAGGAPAVPGPARDECGDGRHDVLLRRLRELGDLHRDGVLTEEEFARTKAAVLGRF